jgi:hypothetical protein
LRRCSRRMPSHARVWRDSILQGDYFGPEFGRGLISHYRSKIMASRKWTNQFCWLCPMNPYLLYVLYGR